MSHEHRTVLRLSDVTRELREHHETHGEKDCARCELWRIYTRGSSPAVYLRLEAIQTVVNEQAEDEGLWFFARTAPEAYLQQELRRLHAAVEGDAAQVSPTAKEPK